MVDGTPELLEPLGQGGSGEVWRARLAGPHGFVREVAVKVLAKGVELDAARQEAGLLAAVRHRAVVRVDGVLEVDGRPALVMELVEGVGLEQLSRLGPVPARVALAIVAEAAAALDAAWSQRGPSGAPLHIVHGDIKPANLLLTPRGETRLLDFGVGGQVAGQGPTGGTPAWMSPERLAGGERSPAADVYGLGAVLFFLVAGRPLGQSSPRLKAHERRVRAALDHAEGLPESLVELLRPMLAHDPSARPTAREVHHRALDLHGRTAGPSLGEWADGAVRLLGDRPGAGAGPEPTVSATVGWVASETAPAPAATVSGRRRGPSPVVWGGLLVVLGIAAGVAWTRVVDPPRRDAAVGPVVQRPPRLVAAPAAAGAASPVAEAASASPPEPPLPPTAPDPAPESAPSVSPPPPPQAAPQDRDPGSLEPPPTSAPPPTVRVAVSFEGDATAVALIGPWGRTPLPAEVPPGTYDTRADFPGLGEMGAGEVTIPAGAPARLRCGGRFTTCAVVP